MLILSYKTEINLCLRDKAFASVTIIIILLYEI